MANFLELLAGLLGQGGGGNMLASPSGMGPNAMDRQPAMAMGAGPMPAFAPEAAGNSYGYEAGIPAPAPQSVPAAPGGGILGRIMGGGRNKGENETIRWLQSKGLDETSAALVAKDGELLQRFMAQNIGPQTDDFGQRATAALKFGLDPNSEEGKRFILTGNLPTETGPTADWSKLDDGRLFNQRTGETREVGQPGGVISPTDDIKEYQFAKANGMFNGSFTEWQTKGIKEQDPTFQREMDLRQQYDALPEVKDYKVVRSNFERIRKGVEMGTGAGDAAIVFGYMKMLDPTSVVREGEQASARNAAGVPETIRGLYNTLVGGGTISGEARNQILQAAEKVYGESSLNIEELNKRYTGFANNYKLDPNRIVSPVEKYEATGGWIEAPDVPGVKIRRKQ